MDPIPKPIKYEETHPSFECTTDTRDITNRLLTAHCCTSVRNPLKIAGRHGNLPKNKDRLAEHENDSKRQPPNRRTHPKGNANLQRRIQAPKAERMRVKAKDGCCRNQYSTCLPTPAGLTSAATSRDDTDAKRQQDAKKRA
jgi:hypothetical protein